MGINDNTNDELDAWVCPLCHEYDLEVMETVYDDDGAMEEFIECRSCETRWSNYYHRVLTNQVILKEGEKK